MLSQKDINGFPKAASPGGNENYAQAAKILWCFQDEAIVIEDNPPSIDGYDGVWVRAWVWISDKDRDRVVK